MSMQLIKAETALILDTPLLTQEKCSKDVLYEC